MTIASGKLVGSGVIALVLWLLRGKAQAAAAADAPPAPGRVLRELDIDANVNSRTFGQPLGEYGANPAVDRDMYELIERSNAAIAADDAPDIRGVGQ